jgi:hypothetical protein
MHIFREKKNKQTKNKTNHQDRAGCKASEKHKEKCIHSPGAMEKNYTSVVELE